MKAEGIRDSGRSSLVDDARKGTAREREGGTVSGKRGPMDICVSGAGYSPAPCCAICLKDSKRTRGHVHLILDFKVVTLKDEPWIAKQWKRVVGLVVVPDVRFGGSLCMDCAQLLSHKLDMAIEAVREGRRYSG